MLIASSWEKRRRHELYDELTKWAMVNRLEPTLVGEAVLKVGVDHWVNRTHWRHQRLLMNLLLKLFAEMSLFKILVLLS